MVRKETSGSKCQRQPASPTFPAGDLHTELPLLGLTHQRGTKLLVNNRIVGHRGRTASELEGTRITEQLFTLLGLAAPLMPGKLLCGHLFFPPISTAALLFQIRCRNGSQKKKTKKKLTTCLHRETSCSHCPRNALFRELSVSGHLIPAQEELTVCLGNLRHK